jgi:hypothetical protein
MGGTDSLCPALLILFFLGHFVDDLVRKINTPIPHVIGSRSENQREKQRNEIDKRYAVLAFGQEPGRIEVEYAEERTPKLAGGRDQCQYGHDESGDLAENSGQQRFELIIFDVLVKYQIIIPLPDPPALDIVVDQIKQKTGNGNSDIIKPVRLLKADQFQVVHKEIDDKHNEDAHHMGIEYPTGKAEKGGFPGILNSSFEHCSPPGCGLLRCSL